MDGVPIALRLAKHVDIVDENGQAGAKADPAEILVITLRVIERIASSATCPLTLRRDVVIARVLLNVRVNCETGRPFIASNIDIQSAENRVSSGGVIGVTLEGILRPRECTLDDRKRDWERQGIRGAGGGGGIR